MGEQLDHPFLDQHPADIKFAGFKGDHAWPDTQFMCWKNNLPVTIKNTDILNHQPIFEGQVKAPDPDLSIQFLWKIAGGHSYQQGLNRIASEYNK